MQIFNKDAVQFLNAELRLPATGDEQDWDVELANPKRIREFIAFYEGNILDDEVKRALMALILASLEDLSHSSKIDDVWKKVKDLICANYDLHKESVDYWALVNEINSEDVFLITKLMRSLDCNK